MRAGLHVTLCALQPRPQAVADAASLRVGLDSIARRSLLALLRAVAERHPHGELREAAAALVQVQVSAPTSNDAPSFLSGGSLDMALPHFRCLPPPVVPATLWKTQFGLSHCF